MNPCVKTEGKCNESVNNEFVTSNNESEQIMKQTHRIHVCLIIFFNSLFSVSGKNPPEKKSSVRGQG